MKIEKRKLEILYGCSNSEKEQSKAEYENLKKIYKHGIISVL